jgi:ketosteroid isomerase-like protein
MDHRANVQLVRLEYEHFKTGNIPALLGLVSEDVEWQLPDIASVPFSGKRRGREQVGQFFAAVNREQETLQFEPRQLIAEGDSVVAIGHYAWRVRSIGRQFDCDWAHVFTVRGGRVAAFQEFTDTALAAAAYRKP